MARGDDSMTARPYWIPVRLWKNASPEVRATAPLSDNVIHIEDGPGPGECRVTVCRKSEGGVVYDAVLSSDYSVVKRVIFDLGRTP